MSRKQDKLKWTERMNSDLLECKRTAKGLISTVDPPRNATGRKKGYIEVMADLWEEKGYGYLGLKSQNLRDQASRLEKMEQEQNYTRNTSTLFESGYRLEIESDDIEEKAPEENNIQADLRNIQNNSPQQQFENANSVISDFHQPVTTESGRVPSPTGLASTIVTDQTKSNQICPIMSRFLPK